MGSCSVHYDVPYLHRCRVYAQVSIISDSNSSRSIPDLLLCPIGEQIIVCPDRYLWNNSTAVYQIFRALSP